MQAPNKCVRQETVKMLMGATGNHQDDNGVRQKTLYDRKGYTIATGVRYSVVHNLPELGIQYMSHLFFYFVEPRYYSVHDSGIAAYLSVFQVTISSIRELPERTFQNPKFEK